MSFFCFNTVPYSCLLDVGLNEFECIHRVIRIVLDSRINIHLQQHIQIPVLSIATKLFIFVAFCIGPTVFPLHKVH